MTISKISSGNTENTQSSQTEINDKKGKRRDSAVDLESNYQLSDAPSTPRRKVLSVNNDSSTADSEKTETPTPNRKNSCARKQSTPIEWKDVRIPKLPVNGSSGKIDCSPNNLKMKTPKFITKVSSPISSKKIGKR